VQNNPLGSQLANIDEGSREDSPLCGYHRTRFSMILGKMCHEHKRLPPLYTITDELKWIGERPSGGGSTADVWRGVYQGSKVAIKVLRTTSRVDLANLERVRPFALYHKNTECTDWSGTAILLRGGIVEAIQTPESPAAGGSEEISRNPYDGFRVDGTWYYQGLYG
jgi:hypothetical protein